MPKDDEDKAIAETIMKRCEKLQGILVPPVTPMFDDGSLDLDGMANYAATLLDAKSVDGLFALGLTGEYPHLDTEERKLLFRTLGQVNRGDKVITANAGGLATAETVKLISCAQEQGLDVAAVVVPTHVEDSTEAIVKYFQEINSVGFAFMVYWPPHINTHKVTIDLIKAMMELPNFVGLKDSSRNMETFASMCAQFGDTISVLQGVEMLHLPSRACGSPGIIGGGLNFYPALVAKLSEAFDQHDLPRAIQLQEQITQSWAAIAKTGCFRSLCKRILQEQGIIKGDFSRADSNPQISEQQLAAVRKMLQL